MDIQGNATASVESSISASRASVGTFENSATERRVEEDSFVERAEVESSDTGEGVGDNVDVSA